MPIPTYSKPKIISFVAGVFILLTFAVFIANHLSSGSGKDKNGFCDFDGNERSLCVSSFKCSEKTLDQCGDNFNMICCPENSIFPESQADESTLNNVIPVIKVGLKNDGVIRNFTNFRKCGLSFGNRIIKGRRAYIGKYPFFVALQYTNESGTGSSILCGGSLISGENLMILIKTGKKL